MKQIIIIALAVSVFASPLAFAESKLSKAQLWSLVFLTTHIKHCPLVSDESAAKAYSKECVDHAVEGVIMVYSAFLPKLVSVRDSVSKMKQCGTQTSSGYSEECVNKLASEVGEELAKIQTK